MGISVSTSGDEAAIDRQARWLAAQPFNKVLDVGGFEKPLRCATHVIDLFPHSNHRRDEGRGELPERFSEKTWTEWDINKTPWPFYSATFDYVWCCQVIEDLRDPVKACQEMMRVGRAGFISTVHRSYESSTVQDDGVVGYHHHRWLIEAVEPAGVKFVWKSPILHVDPTYRPPQAKQWLLHWTWKHSFEVEETFTGGDCGQRAELLGYLERWQE